MSTNAAFGTPTLLVHSNRGLPIRTLRYNRETVGDALDERIDRTTYDPIGHAASRIDARFFAASGSPLPNFAYASSLSGQVLRTDSVDAGPQWDLSDVEGRPVWARDGRGTTTTWAHDALGRPLTRAEAVGDESAATRDVWIYGEREANAQEHNLRGQCVRCYDTAGKLAWRAFRLTGQPLNETRWLLADPDIDSNWPGQDDETAWDRALDATAYSTAWGHDATGAWYRQTDAMGNTQQRCVDVAGRLASSRLQPEKGAEQVVLSSVVYSAAGQILSETAGNGMVGSYAYEPQTRRLIGLKVVRPAKTGRATIVQDVSYRYDPVGNVIRVSDAAQAPSYWRKQKTESASVYRYDALYQLIGATGREIAKRGVQGHSVPPATIPLPVDDSVYSNYTRTYTYDRSGNLTTIGHQGTINYKQAIVVSNRSNHAMLQDGAGTLTPDGIDNGKWFDASGNQQQQLPDATQPLGWNGGNRLQRVTFVKRSGPDDDRETYQYDGDGMRVRKRLSTQGKGAVRTVDAIYLPGVTLRVTSSGDGKQMSVSESLHEMSCAAGNVRMRCLRWVAGQPKSATNDTVRYGLTDATSSIAVELDAGADLISREEYYPYGGTAVWEARSQVEADTKYVRFSGKERDATGLYYYGYRYYQPWIGRWLNADPAGIDDGLNLYRMVRNNPTTLIDWNGLVAVTRSRSQRAVRLTRTRRGGVEGRSVHAMTLRPRRATVEFVGIDPAQGGERVAHTHSRFHDPASGRYIERDPIGLRGGSKRYDYVPIDKATIREYSPNRWRDPRGRFTEPPGWPADDGFAPGEDAIVTLGLGTRVDRFGHPGGRYVAPAGTPFGQRSMPDRSYASDYHLYEVKKSIGGVRAGPAAPWFGQPGGGIQYRLTTSVQAHIDASELTEIFDGAVKPLR